MADGYDEQTDADQLDVLITSVLAGRPARGTDPTVLWLAAAVRSEPSASLHRRIARRVERQERLRWRPTQLVAAVFASVLITHGIGNIVNNAWVAKNLGEGNSPHAFIEGGLAILAVAVIMSVAVFRYRALPYAVASGGPLGLVYGVRGFGEVGEFAAGAVLHIGQGVLAIALIILWWRARRYGSSGTDEGGA